MKINLGAPLEKILREIWINRARSLLVVATLTIGIAAVGAIFNGVRMMKRDLFAGFAQRNPASVRLYLSPFPKELATSVADMREVRLAQARRQVNVTLQTPASQSIDLRLVAFPDFKDIRIYRLDYEKGQIAPPLRTVLLERNTAAGLGISLGDSLSIKTENGAHFSLTVSGIVQDMSTPPYNISGDAQGYVSMPTLEWMGEAPAYNILDLIVAPGASTREQALSIAAAARDRIIEPAGYKVATIQIPGTGTQPGEFWARKQVDGMLLVLQVMSVLAIFLCGGLIVNTVNAVLVQQVRQIGIMRSVGASRWQIAGMYLAYVFVLSVIGLVIAIPLGMAGAWGLTAFAASFLNFNVSVVDLPPSLFFLLAGLGLLMPSGVALFPILRETRLSVYDAIYQTGANSGDERGGFDALLARLRRLSPPILLSLRNTFRNKSRLAFTLVTLTVAGIMFTAVFSSYATLDRQVRELGRYIAFDAALSIPGGANRHTVEREALRISGVQVAEGWASTNGTLVHADGSESDRIEVVGLPPSAQTLQPRLIAGRWLQAGDAWAVVASEDLLSSEPQLKAGSEITLRLGKTDRRFQVVGITSRNYTKRLYMTDEQFGKLTGAYNQVDSVRVLASSGSFSPAAAQESLGRRLEQPFKNAKLSTAVSETRNKIFSSMLEAFKVLLIVLLIVASILAIIGGLGLTGTMGLNVLERTREVGVLRAVGASHRSVRQVVVVEGVAVALISWALSALFSPLPAALLAAAVVRATFNTVAPFECSFPGLFAWLAIVVLIGVFASLAPARNAARMTVREVLSYE